MGMYQLRKIGSMSFTSNVPSIDLSRLGLNKILFFLQVSKAKNN